MYTKVLSSNEYDILRAGGSYMASILHFDQQNIAYLSSKYSLAELQQHVAGQVSMLSVKEIFGYLIVGVLILFVALLFEKKVKPGNFSFSFPGMLRICYMIRRTLPKM